MNDPAIGALVLLGLWATLAGLDLVSVPQGLLSRPIVVGAASGWILGDPAAGFRIGVLLELFDLDVLPVGAVRYPDYAAATAGAVLAAAGAPTGWALGPATALGLLLASLGGFSLQAVRHANATAVRRAAAGLAAGDLGTIRGLQLGGIARDFARAAVLAGLAIGAGLLARAWPWTGEPLHLAVALSIALIGAGVSAAASGALRNAGRGLRLRWVAAGAVAGLAWAMLR